MSTGVPSCDDSYASIMSYFAGTIFGACLYGALTVQLYRYYISFPKDRKLLKVVIYIVYVAETIFTVLLVYDLGASIYYIYDHSVNLDPVNGLSPTGAFDRGARFSHFSIIQILGACGGIVAFLTQSMYAYRIRIITKLKYMPWVIILAMAFQLIAIVTLMLSMLSVRVLSTFCVMIIWTSMSLIVDVTTTGIMVWVLKKEEICSKQLKEKVARLIYLILGTGFFTAATNLCILVLSLYSSSSCIGPLIILAKLYANSMMVLVNSRIPSARTEINHRATLDMITIRFSSFHATSQEAADAEQGQQEISVTPEVRGLSTHEADDTPNNVGSSTV